MSSPIVIQKATLNKFMPFLEQRLPDFKANSLVISHPFSLMGDENTSKLLRTCPKTLLGEFSDICVVKNPEGAFLEQIDDFFKPYCYDQFSEDPIANFDNVISTKIVEKFIFKNVLIDTMSSDRNIALSVITNEDEANGGRITYQVCWSTGIDGNFSPDSPLNIGPILINKFNKNSLKHILNLSRVNSLKYVAFENTDAPYFISDPEIRNSLFEVSLTGTWLTRSEREKELAREHIRENAIEIVSGISIVPLAIFEEVSSAFPSISIFSTRKPNVFAVKNKTPFLLSGTTSAVFSIGGTTATFPIASQNFSGCVFSILRGLLPIVTVVVSGSELIKFTASFGKTRGGAALTVKTLLIEAVVSQLEEIGSHPNFEYTLVDVDVEILDAFLGNAIIRFPSPNEDIVNQIASLCVGSGAFACLRNIDVFEDLYDAAAVYLHGISKDVPALLSHGAIAVRKNTIDIKDVVEKSLISTIEIPNAINDYDPASLEIFADMSMEEKTKIVVYNRHAYTIETLTILFNTSRGAPLFPLNREPAFDLPLSGIRGNGVLPSNGRVGWIRKNNDSTFKFQVHGLKIEWSPYYTAHEISKLYSDGILFNEDENGILINIVTRKAIKFNHIHIRILEDNTTSNSSAIKISNNIDQEKMNDCFAVIIEGSGIEAVREFKNVISKKNTQGVFMPLWRVYTPLSTCIASGAYTKVPPHSILSSTYETYPQAHEFAYKWICS